MTGYRTTYSSCDNVIERGARSKLWFKLRQLSLDPCFQGVKLVCGIAWTDPKFSHDKPPNVIKRWSTFRSAPRIISGVLSDLSIRVFQ